MLPLEMAIKPRFLMRIRWITWNEYSAHIQKKIPARGLIWEDDAMGGQ
jgi:hypothetical protein